jgi:twitching motility protein PilT
LKSIRPGVGRVPTVEIMTFTPLIRKLVLEEEDHRLTDAIRVGAEDGMQDFTQSLKKLVDDEMIDREVAMEVAPNREQLKMALKGIDVAQGGMV